MEALQTTEVELKESLEESYKIVTTEFPSVCKPGDKECTQRWIQAFSDCD